MQIAIMLALQLFATIPTASPISVGKIDENAAFPPSELLFNGWELPHVTSRDLAYSLFPSTNETYGIWPRTGKLLRFHSELNHSSLDDGDRGIFGRQVIIVAPRLAPERKAPAKLCLKTHLEWHECFPPVEMDLHRSFCITDVPNRLPFAEWIWHVLDAPTFLPSYSYAD